MRLLLCCFIFVQFNFTENLAQLENMYRRTGNLEALYFLAKGLIVEKSFKKAAKVIKILDKKMPKSPKVLDLDVQVKWATHKKYEAYKVIYESLDSEFRDDKLSFIKYKSKSFYPYFRLRYEFESTQNMDEVSFENLLKQFPKNKLLLKLLRDYFIFLEEYEFAYDLTSDYPKFLGDVEKFEALGSKYNSNCKKRVINGKTDDDTKYSCFFAWKFTPFLMSNFKKLEIKDLIWFFEEKVSHRKTNTFENYYRLSYLYARIKETENAKVNLSKAIEKSPSYFFDLILEKLPDKYMAYKKIDPIEIDDIMSLPGAKSKMKSF